MRQFCCILVLLAPVSSKAGRLQTPGASSLRVSFQHGQQLVELASSTNLTLVLPPKVHSQPPDTASRARNDERLSPDEMDALRKEVEENVKEDLKRDLENELEDEIEKEVKEKSRKEEQQVKADIKRDVEKELAEEGIGYEERLSPLGEKTLKSLDRKWLMFQVTFGILVLGSTLLACLSYSVQHDDPTSPRDVQMTENLVDDKGPPRGIYTALAAAALLCPAGVLTKYMQFSSTATFWVNLLAIVPEAHLLGIATEELAEHMGDAVGAMLNASFGNSVELIFVYFTLKDGLVDACSGSLVGSILSNHLVLLGASFLVGGMLTQAPYRFRLNRNTAFDASAATDQAQQLLMASFAITLPAIFADMQHVKQSHVVALSMAFSAFLLLSYVALVFHQLTGTGRRSALQKAQLPEAYMSIKSAGAMLLASTILLGVSSECMVEALDDFCHQMGLSQTFVGVVLLPLAGDISHWSAVFMAMRGKMDLSIQIAMASAVQIALVVVPLSVFMGHFMDQPMTLSLGAVQGVILNMSAIITFAVMVDGKSSWMRGFTLLTVFSLICLLIFFIPDVIKL